MWATSVRLTISQVSVVPSFGWASARAGLKVLPLISQVVLKTPPIEISQVRLGVRRDVLGPGGKRPQLARHAGAIGQAPRVDPELHQGADVGPGAERVAGAVARAAAQLDALAGRAGEVDHDLGPLPRTKHHLAPPHRRRHQAAVGADLDQRGSVGEEEVVGAELGDVEDAQPVALCRDPVVGHVGAVDEDAAAVDPVVGRAQVRERIGQLVVAVEGAVGDHQRQVALARAAAAGRRRARRRRSTSPPGRARRCARCGRGGGRGTTGRRLVRARRPPSGRRRRCACPPARSAGRCRTARGESPRGMSQ